MGRIKERRKILHEPSTQEIFQCLRRMPVYSKILSENKTDKAYIVFLKWLTSINFYNGQEGKISIKKIATDFKIDTAKATKWINEIYQDIFELNHDRPELFQKDGVKVTLYMHSYDNHYEFNISMLITPREFETLRFPFAHAKIGMDHFWVKKVEHEIEENGTSVTIWLEGGFLNRYREFALDKALFQGRIGVMDVYDKHSFELDEEIKKICRD